MRLFLLVFFGLFAPLHLAFGACQANYETWQNAPDVIRARLVAHNISVSDDAWGRVVTRMQYVAAEVLTQELHPVCALIDAASREPEFFQNGFVERIVGSYYHQTNELADWLGYAWGTQAATGLNALAYQRARVHLSMNGFQLEPFVIKGLKEACMRDASLKDYGTLYVFSPIMVEDRHEEKRRSILTTDPMYWYGRVNSGVGLMTRDPSLVIENELEAYHDAVERGDFLAMHVLADLINDTDCEGTIKVMERLTQKKVLHYWVELVCLLIQRRDLSRCEQISCRIIEDLDTQGWLRSSQKWKDKDKQKSDKKDESPQEGDRESRQEEIVINFLDLLKVVTQEDPRVFWFRLQLCLISGGNTEAMARVAEYIKNDCYSMQDVVRKVVGGDPFVCWVRLQLQRTERYGDAGGYTGLAEVILEKDNDTGAYSGVKETLGQTDEQLRFYAARLLGDKRCHGYQWAQVVKRKHNELFRVPQAPPPVCF